MKRNVIFGAILVIVSACSSEEGVTAPPDKWKTLADGSVFLEREDKMLPEQLEATRCWKESEKYLCLGVYSDTGQLPHVVSVSSYVAPKPLRPSEHFTESGRDETSGYRKSFPSNGYTCTSLDYDQILEQMSGPKGVLASSYDRKWTKSYVNKFLEDNDAPGWWFDCSKITSIVHDGSLASIRSTLVTKDIVFP